MLENRVLKFLFSLMLFVSTVLTSFIILVTFESHSDLFQWGIVLTALFLTLPLYLYRLKISESKSSYIFYSALSSIAIVFIVSISYTMITLYFNDYRSSEVAPNLLAFTIIPFYILMCLKYKPLNKINSKFAIWLKKTYGIVGTWGAVGIALILLTIISILLQLSTGGFML